MTDLYVSRKVQRSALASLALGSNPQADRKRAFPGAHFDLHRVPFSVIEASVRGHKGYW